jgi:hypothetical protein
MLPYIERLCGEDGLVKNNGPLRGRTEQTQVQL